MNNLKISSSKDTLGITCDVQAGFIEMEGNSYPMDAAEFFSPVFDWLDKYVSEINAGLDLNLRINYLNSSSTKCLFDLIDKVEEYFSTGGAARINWYYKSDDKDIEETGKEFKEDLIIPFDLIAY